MNVWRQPVSQVVCDGQPVAGVMSWEVSDTSKFAANSWKLSISINSDPGGLAVWDNRTNSTFEISIGLQSGLTSLITGQPDTIDVDPIEGVIHVEGRDLTSRFLSTRISETFANQTSSQVAGLLAQRQGLSGQISPTNTPIGRFYGSEHDRVTLDRYNRINNEWDLLVWLADHEGFSVYVTGSTLVFAPVPAVLNPVLTLSATPNGPLVPNVKSLRLNRAYSLAGPVSVTVKSWNSQSQINMVQTVTSGGNGQGLPAAYVFIRPNLTSGQALALANQKLSAILAHQYMIMAELPGEVLLTSQDSVSLVGTNSAFDQNYAIETITRTFSVMDGFNEVIRARSQGT